MQDYFRDFSQDDLRALLPLLRDPRDDPAYKVGAAFNCAALPNPCAAAG